MKNAINHQEFNGNPEQLQKILRSQYGGQALACKLFSKEVKQYVTSTKVIHASAARRKCEARFVCPIEGCTSKFTRQHNLNSKHVSLFMVSPCHSRTYSYDLDHLKAHCGITDMICHICGKAFATRSVLSRHLITCLSKSK